MIDIDEVPTAFEICPFDTEVWVGVASAVGHPGDSVSAACPISPGTRSRFLGDRARWRHGMGQYVKSISS